ncbi:MAG: hypothetical protein L6Q58_16530, partial [Rivicola pingtungensis]
MGFFKELFNRGYDLKALKVKLRQVERERAARAVAEEEDGALGEGLRRAREARREIAEDQPEVVDVPAPSVGEPRPP